VIEFNKTVVEHLESGTLLQEIEGYGIVQPSFTEYYHEKFRHFIIGDYNKGLKEEEKVQFLSRTLIQISVSDNYVDRRKWSRKNKLYLFGS
jgi:hypothetical protein